jgi:hypothetical protein
MEGELTAYGSYGHVAGSPLRKWRVRGGEGHTELRSVTRIAWPVYYVRRPEGGVQRLSRSGGGTKKAESSARTRR